MDYPALPNSEGTCIGVRSNGLQPQVAEGLASHRTNTLFMTCAVAGVNFGGIGCRTATGVALDLHFKSNQSSTFKRSL